MQSNELLKKLQADLHLKRYFINQQDIENVRRIGNLLKPEMPRILDEFYMWMLDSDDFLAFFPTPESLTRVKLLQIAHWNTFFEVNLDGDYFKQRRKVGEVHAKTGLPLDLFFSGVICFNGLFERTLKRLELQEIELIQSFHKIVSMDVSIIVETYSNMMRKSIEDREKELATPISKLWKGVLFVPLVGEMTARRMANLMNMVLARIAETQSKVFIMDISAVKKVDTVIASDFVKMTKATRLMGTETIISGISPIVAQTIVELGVPVQQIRTTNTLAAAIEDGLWLMGLEVKERAGVV